MIPILSEPTIHALGWTLVHFLWQGAMVAAVLAIARVFVRNSTVRYAMSIAALAACALFPVATFVSGAASTDEVMPAVYVPFVDPSSLTVDVPISPRGELSVERGLNAPGTPLFLELSVGPQPLMAVSALHQYAPVIVFAWGVGMVLMTARLVRSCWLTRRLRRVGVSPLPGEWASRVQTLARELGLRRGVQVMTSSIAAIPMAVGVLRPVVLIPVATLLGLTQEQLEAILLHELVHVRRYDGLVVLAERLVETVLFYHPAVWWISACCRTEREHCCDDVVATRTDVRLYAGALATVEQLRVPALAAAAADGSLLMRVRRLIAPSTVGSTGITLPNVIATLALLSVTGVAIGVTAHATAEEEMNGDNLPGVLLEDVRVPTRVDFATERMGLENWSGSSGGNGGSFSTIVDAYVATLGAGGDRWSVPHVAATFGYPFHFAMRDGAVYHDHNCNIETWQFFDRMDGLGWATQSFKVATGAGNTPDHQALADAQEQAWEAVTASIDRGLPAIAWSPRERHHLSDWGLLVGYDGDTKSYHVNHVQTDSIYTIPYDGFGQVWFNVIVFTQPTKADPREEEITTLRRAVEFSRGLRYTVEESQNCCGVDAIGFDAYQLWIDALDSGDFNGSEARKHAWQLYHTRRLAAQYVREAADRFGGAVGARLDRAGDHYVQESERGRKLLSITAGWSQEPPPPSEVAEAQELLKTMLAWEQGAVWFLETALLGLGEEIPGGPTNENVAMLQATQAKVGVDVAPTEPHRGTTLASSLEPVFMTLGKAEWSPARIQGVLGHVFHFQMAEGGGDVWHDNLDWSLAMEVLKEVAQYRSYEVQKEGSDADRALAESQAWDAVRLSLDRGVPALIWNPRSAEQRQARHPAGHAACWGLIVGYDETQETYTIRHPFVWEGDYTVRYDADWENQGGDWFNIMVFDDVKNADDVTLHRMALTNALSFADGTRLGEHRWTQGLHAYETWLAAFESPDLPDITHHHANMLTYRRELAVEYLRDLSAIFEGAAEPLAAAASHYEREHALLEQLKTRANTGRMDGYTDQDRTEMSRLLRAAFEEERAAVDQIRVALAMLGE